MNEIKRILTIDWDYFFKIPFEVRNDKFPQIENGSLSHIPDNNLWIEEECFKYEQSVDFASIRALMSNLNTFSTKQFFVSENHGEMCNVFISVKSQYPECNFEITNIDYHHDFSYSGSEVHCDNWARLIKEKFPETEFKWCKKEDSLTTTFGEEVPTKIIDFSEIMEKIRTGYYEFIHLCRSDLYSPPLGEADYWFNELVSYLSYICYSCVDHTVGNKIQSRRLIAHNYTEGVIKYESKEK